MYYAKLVYSHITEILVVLYAVFNFLIGIKAAPTKEGKYNVIKYYLELLVSRIVFVTYKDHRNSLKLPGAPQPGLWTLDEINDILAKSVFSSKNN